jgi:hypothetical protein
MKKNLMYLLILPICLFGLVLLPTSAQALVFTIDKVLTGDGYTTGWDFGTVTLSDSFTFGSDYVDIDVVLNDSSDYINAGSHLKVIALNYSGSFESGYYFHAFYYPGAILYDPDNVQMGGFGSNFDLRIPDGSLGNQNFPANLYHDYSDTIGLFKDTFSNPINIDPEDFYETTGGVYMAFHIGGLETDIDDSDSVWAGANLPNSVPEPATMLLLGVGLIGLAGIGRKKFVKK